MSNMLTRRSRPKLLSYRCFSYEGKNIGDIHLTDIASPGEASPVLTYGIVYMKEDTDLVLKSLSNGQLNKYSSPNLYEDEDPPITVYKLQHVV